MQKDVKLATEKLARLRRFRLRLAALLNRTAASPPLRPAPEPASQRLERSAKAKLFHGNARSDLGSTSPWLMLPAERNFSLYVPEHPLGKDTAPMPLLVMIHGCKQSADDFARGTRMNDLAAREGFAVLYAEQSSFANFRRCWNWFEPNTAAGHGECAIVLEMIVAAKKLAKIDAHRVYAAGMSSGAALAGLLAFHHPDQFAGVAMHSGLPPLANPSASSAILAMRNGVRIDTGALAESYWEIQADFPPPLIVIHGDDDHRVHERNATASMKLWEALWEGAPDGAAPNEMTALTRNDKALPAAEGSRAYAQMDLLRSGRIVARSVRVAGLAHAWSGGNPELEFNDARAPDASELIWRFLSRQSRSG
ncbi:MAG: phospholipase [Betaproteobacteria bacterium]|nr:MAG: phospholipase [Betaproteobacteria bacterium]